MADTLENNIPEPTVILQNKPSFFQSLKSFFLSRIVLIILFTLVLFLIVLAAIFISRFSSQLPSEQTISPPTQPTAKPKQAEVIKSYNSQNFDQCLFDKTKDKLITIAEKQKDGTFFIGMSGNIMDIQTNLDQTKVTLTAPDGSSAYQFTLPNNERIVLESSQSKIAVAVSNLKTFLSVQVFGICDPKVVGNKLTINQINILGDLTKRK